MTDAEVLDRFAREYITYHRISEERAKAQRKLLLEFAASMGRPLLQGDGDAVQVFAGQLLASGLHVNTVRKKLNMVRPFYAWCYAARLVTAEQYMSVRTVKDPRGASPRSVPNPYTRKEIQEFWGTLEARWPLLPSYGRGSKAISRWLQGKGSWGRVYRHAMRLQLQAATRLALDLGLRRSEIFGLSVHDLHYDNEYLVVRGKADPTTGEVQIRQVPFTQEARRTIKLWLDFRALMRPDHDRPWISCWDDVRTKPMWETRFKVLLQRTVGPQWRWHRFRHTCATEWLRARAELEVVSRLLGHSTLDQTLAYAEILKSDIAVKLGRAEADFAEATRAA